MLSSCRPCSVSTPANQPSVLGQRTRFPEVLACCQKVSSALKSAVATTPASSSAGLGSVKVLTMPLRAVRNARKILVGWISQTQAAHSHAHDPPHRGRPALPVENSHVGPHPTVPASVPAVGGD